MTLHVVGAGMAGLASAIAAADAGLEVVLHESTKLAGGRCRSWDDALIGRRIDNGTHVVVGGNPAAHAYMRRIGSQDSLRPLPRTPAIFDLAAGTIWRAGPLALARAFAGSIWRLGFDDRGTVAERMRDLADYRRLWEPLAVGALNTSAELASAALFRTVLASAVWRGLNAARMHMVRDSLAESFVTPALDLLAKLGVTVRFGRPLRELAMRDGRATELQFDDETIVLSRHDAVISAVPWWIAARWLALPALPDSPIVNVHFRLTAPPERLANHAVLGMVGGTAQWVFRRDDILSAHVSAAAGLDERTSEEIAELMWRDVARALSLAAAPDAVRVVKEKRATLLHSLETESLRPHRRQGENLFLAGDWTATGLPCTIEGAIRSGNAAAADAVALLRDQRAAA
jgi:phytoene dehydrogenase-like protein